MKLYDIIVVIPMAGLGSRFSEYGFKKNKYMIPINKSLEPMISMAITTLMPKNCLLNMKWIFIIKNDIEKSEISETLEKICRENSYDFEIRILDKLTQGPASTVYEIRDILEKHCDIPLIVSNSDQVLDYKSTNFLNVCENYDGCVLTYKPNYHLELGSLDKHSFVKYDDNWKVIDVSEKIVLSSHALIGVHYYKKCSYFLDAYEYMVSKNIRAPNGEFYLSLTYKGMLDTNRTVGTYEFGNDEFFYPVGEPLDYFKYLNENSDYIFDFKNVFNYVVSEKYRIEYNNVESNSVLEFKNSDYIAVVSGSCIVNDTVLKQDCVYNILPGESVKFLEHTKYFSFMNKNTIERDSVIYNIRDFVRGWIVGFFEKSIYKTEEFEIASLIHEKGQKHDFHYHSIADEYNILMEGSMMLNGILINENSFFIIYKNQIACPKFLTDCKVLCIKIPSVKNDKYII